MTLNESMTRDDLNAAATEAGVADPESFANKTELISAIQALAPDEQPGSEDDVFQRLADAYEKDGTMEPGYGYRYVTRGGETHVVAEKL